MMGGAVMGGAIRGRNERVASRAHQGRHSPAAPIERLGFELGNIDTIEAAHVDGKHVLAIP
jgi:hypothetical protein